MVRYSKLGYVEFNVSDVGRSCDFYRDLVGMQEIGTRRDGAVLLRCDNEPYSLVLHHGDRPGYKRAGWMLEDHAQFEALHARLRAAGVPFEELSAEERTLREFARGTRTAEPNSHATLEFYIPEVKDVQPIFEPSHTKIQRLGHVVWTTPGKDDAVQFFTEILNFRISDNIGPGSTFLRPFPSPYHHGIGIGESVRRSLHHLNLMVTEIDDVGRGIHRMRANGVPILKGLGRHPASGSIFLYFLDPDGLTVEYSFGMEKFPEHSPRQPRVYPPVPESIDEWLGPIDRTLDLRGEIEIARIGPA